MCMGCSCKKEKDVAITNAFQKILDESGRKPHKIRVELTFLKQFILIKQVHQASAIFVTMGIF